MKEIYQFILTFYKIYNTKSSWQLKKLYRETFEHDVYINDSECDSFDKSCMFDELYDELINQIWKLIQNVWWIIYCDLFWWFLISEDWEEWRYRINSEELDEKINEAAGYFYDLFNS